MQSAPPPSCSVLRGRRAIVRRLQGILGVQMTSVRELPSREKSGWYHHPAYPLAFSPEERKVYYLGSMDEWLPYLPHELVHAVWPDDPQTADEEWAIGMISYERAWIERLQPDPVFKAELLEYTEEGSPLGTPEEEAALFAHYESLAREVVARYGLPDPFNTPSPDNTPESP